MKPPSCAVPLLLAFSVVAQNVFLHPTPRGNDALRELEPAQANLVLTQHLGLEKFEDLQQDEPLVNQYLVDNAPQEFVGKQLGKTLVVSVESSSLDFLPEQLRSSQMTIDTPTDSAFSFDALVSTYLHRAARIFNSIRTSRGSSTSNAQPSKPFGSDIFMETMGPLNRFIETTKSSSAAGSSTFAAFEVKGLEESRANDELYRHAVQMLRRALEEAILHTSKLAILVAPPPSSFSSLDKRQEEEESQPPQSPLPGDQSPIPPQEPYFSVSTCHATKKDCKEATDDCSDHGACTNATRIIKGSARSCFVCACKPTVKKDRTTVWVGAACEKEDVSVPFALLAGTTIVLLVLVFGTVALLYGIGTAELPKTLTASASGGHLKKE